MSSAARPPVAVLIGPPGAGKTTVGGLLAGLLGVGYTDTDAAVEAVAGKPVGDIFVEDGEPAFRALEREAVAAALAGGGPEGIVGLGGGAVLDPGTQALLAGHQVVYLETGFTDLAKRVGLDKPRPLLIGINPRAQLKTLLDQRRPVYSRLATITVGTDQREPAQIAAEIATALKATGVKTAGGARPVTATRIKVSGEQPYEIVVGRGVLGELPGLIGPGARAAVVVHARGRDALAARACEVLAGAGYAVSAEPVPDGEAAKEIGVAAGLWSRLAAREIGRRDVIVGVGGGAVTDLAGFAAATWLRGVRVVLVPTTLLGMADAAIGGKTAVNIAEGKNLVGAFHPPAGVLADLDTLATLPPAEYASGLAEVIKAGFIADPVILDLVEADPAAAARPGGRSERELVERAIAMKAGVVSADLREAGQREFLNYGHTLGHAIERAEGYTMRHGDAVAIGLVYAAAVGWLAGRLDEPTARRHREILSAAGLPVAYRAGAWPRLRAAMALDKKSRDARLRLVVLDGLARPGILADPPEELLERAYAEVSRP